MDTPEYNILERIIISSPNKIHLSQRARREIPLRKVILASRIMELARREQNKLIMMTEAEGPSHRHETDWWFTNNNNNKTATATTDPDTPSALLDTCTLLDTGIIDFESSPLFTAPTPPPLLDTFIDYNNTTTSSNESDSTNNTLDTSLDATSDWSWLKEDKILEPISASVLLSHIDYDEEEDEESESEEEIVITPPNNDLLLVVVSQQDKSPSDTTESTSTNDNLLVVFGNNKEQETINDETTQWITIIPSNTNNSNNKKRHLSTTEDEEQQQQQDMSPTKRRGVISIRT